MKYRTIFSNLHGNINTEIDNDDDMSECFYPMLVNGVEIETDGFEGLSIENPEQYPENKLAQFDYDIKYPYKDKEKKLLVLKNYQLKAFIPIQVLEKESGKRMKVDMEITMTYDGNNFKRICSLLGKNSDYSDMEVAFRELQTQLKNDYSMEICSNCKNSSWHPYGGNEFFNHLCFEKESIAFQFIENKTKTSVGGFMKYGNDENWELVQLTDYCDKFEAQ